MFNSAMTFSGISSRYLTKARNELPWAAITTFLPDLISGAITLVQYGKTRSRVVWMKNGRVIKTFTPVLGSRKGKYCGCVTTCLHSAQLSTYCEWLCCDLSSLRVVDIFRIIPRVVRTGLVDWGWRNIVRSTPYVHLRLAVLSYSIFLIKPLKSSIMSACISIVNFV